MIEILDESHGDTVGLRVDGGISVDDLRRVESDLENVFAEHGKVNVVAVVESMEGYGFKEFLEDLRFVFKHWSQFQRVAVVGRSEWMKLVAKVDSALAPWEERFFTPDQIEQAWIWAEGKA